MPGTLVNSWGVESETAGSREHVCSGCMIGIEKYMCKYAKMLILDLVVAETEGGQSSPSGGRRFELSPRK